MHAFLLGLFLVLPVWAADPVETPKPADAAAKSDVKVESSKQAPAILTPPADEFNWPPTPKKTKKAKSETKAAPAVSSPAVSEAAASAPPASGADMFSSLDYPELQVVPRATERLAMEAQNENWVQFWPFTLSAVATLYDGMKLHGSYSDGDSDDQKKQLDYFSQAASMVGVLWIGLTTYYIFTKPYASENKKIRNLGGRDRRGELLRERLAEEALERPARMVEIFTWASVITNFCANAILFGQSTPNNNIYPIGGMIAAFMPMIFNNRYVESYQKHLEYKRKIYAPIAYVDFYQPRLSARLEPKMVLQWSF